MNLGKAKRIFIIDDDALMSEALADYLMTLAPHTITKYMTGEECLRAVGDTPDFVILDYFLNSSNREAATGTEVLPAIKKHFPKARVIMLSGQEKYAVAMKSIQKGAEEYVIKGEGSFEKIGKLISDAN